MHKKFLHYYFLARNSRPVWNFLNRKGRHLLKANPRLLDNNSERIVSDLVRDGIAVTSLDELFPGENLLEKLNQFKDRLNPEEAEQGKKAYLKKYWDRFPTLDLSNPFLELTLRSQILSIANAYMKQWTILRYFDLAKTLPVGENTDAVQSQRWHRDPEEKRMVKMFIYLNDVDNEAGPFTYVYGSADNGKFGHLFPQETPLGSYPNPEEFNRLIPKENIKVMTGKAGTVIFCNTAGLHKGGFATKKERIMYTAFLSSSTYSEKPLYKIPEGMEPEVAKLSDEARFALSKV